MHPRILKLLYPIRIALWWLRSCRKCRAYPPSDYCCANCYGIWPAYHKPLLTDRHF